MAEHASLDEAYAAISAAIADCEDPATALRIVFQMSPERRAVLSFAAGHVNLHRGKLARARDFAKPWPSMIDAIKVWDHQSALDQIDRSGRVGAGGFFTALIIVTLATWISGKPLTDPLNVLLFHVAVIGLGAMLAFAFRPLWSSVLWRRLGGLDELEALEIVVGHIEKIAARNPLAGVSILGRTRSRFQPREPAPRWYEFDHGRQIDKTRRWTAKLDHEDTTRKVGVYRVRLWNRTQPAGELFVDIPLRDDGSAPEARDIAAVIHARVRA